MGTQSERDINYPSLMSPVLVSDGLLEDGDIVERSDGKVLTAVFTTVTTLSGIPESRFVAGVVDLRVMSTGDGSYAMNASFVEVGRSEVLTFLGNPLHDKTLAAPRHTSFSRIEMRSSVDIAPGTPILGRDGRESTMGTDSLLAVDTVAVLL